MSFFRTKATGAAAVAFSAALALSTAAVAQQGFEERPSDFSAATTVDRSMERGSGSQFYGLPGVDVSDGAGRVGVRGPGGLENNVGAIGMATPSISSENPLPLQRDGTAGGGGFTIGRY
ncbi:hypothetical protein [Fulvimarina endophytica]|uniref:hypothetical protein n=1 Tax=Fulvimarina endophytica TaxID=2293836 RepID=UPI0011C05E19|nr:hypothetical protein [Fulvimarina endophytica]